MNSRRGAVQLLTTNGSEGSVLGIDAIDPHDDGNVPIGYGIGKPDVELIQTADCLRGNSGEEDILAAESCAAHGDGQAIERNG